MSNVYLNKFSKLSENIKPFQIDNDNNEKKLNSNVEKFKDIKLIFKDKYTSLLEKIENIPKDIIEDIEKNKEKEEISPASIVNTIFWEWEYCDISNRKFIQENELYKTKMQDTSGNIDAYSSISLNENYTFKLKFNDCNQFSCGGFGVISKNHPQFNTKSFNGISNIPICCMCCSGAWNSCNYELFGRPALQHVLKSSSSDEKNLSFEFNFDEMMFKVFEPNGDLYGKFDLNKLEQKDDLVLIYYSGSSTDYSFEIINE